MPSSAAAKAWSPSSTRRRCPARTGELRGAAAVAPDPCVDAGDVVRLGVHTALLVPGDGSFASTGCLLTLRPLVPPFGAVEKVMRSSSALPVGMVPRFTGVVAVAAGALGGTLEEAARRNRGCCAEGRTRSPPVRCRELVDLAVDVHGDRPQLGHPPPGGTRGTPSPPVLANPPRCGRRSRPFA